MATAAPPPPTTAATAATAVAATGSGAAPSPALFLPPAPTRFPLHAQFVPPPAFSFAPSSSSPSPATSSSGAPFHVDDGAPSRLLIVGDIHGCLSELTQLVELAGIRPGGRDMVLAAGDLVGKGPDSRGVVEYMMRNGFLAVLGNHDQYLLRCALMAGKLEEEKGDRSSRAYETDEAVGKWNEENVREYDLDSDEYARVYYARMNGYHSRADPKAEHYRIAQTMSQEQLEWMATRPLTIRVNLDRARTTTTNGLHQQDGYEEVVDAPPESFLVVHAGVVPGVRLEHQHPFHLTTMRNLVPQPHHDQQQLEQEQQRPQQANGNDEEQPQFEPSESNKIGAAWSMTLPQPSSSSPSSPPSSTSQPQPAPSLSSPPPPPTIIFGHDAMRGFQRPNRYRLGLDTGCCFGKDLTGVLLPEGRMVNVPAARQYSKPKSDVDVARRPPPTGAKLDQVVPVEPAKARAETAHESTPAAAAPEAAANAENAKQAS